MEIVSACLFKRIFVFLRGAIVRLLLKKLQPKFVAWSVRAVFQISLAGKMKENIVPELLQNSLEPAFLWHTIPVNLASWSRNCGAFIGHHII